MRLKCEPESRLEPNRIPANSEGLGHVYECPCGATHLVLGAVSLTFSRQSFMQVAQAHGRCGQTTGAVFCCRGWHPERRPARRQ